MSDKLFVIAIGGTGMRCLESFVHLCAIGMFDNQEIEILTLDTDQTNGNMGRVWHLIDTYNKIKSSDSAKVDGGNPNTDTFFSAKLNLFKFYTNYNDASRISYQNLSKLSDGSEEVRKHNQMLSDLFLDKESVQKFHLDHGYRAQTHLGSHLMYHGIIEAARRLAEGKDVGEPEKNLELFLGKLQKSGENSRVFVFGSVFGGTGASSIPVIPVAFRDAIFIRSGEKETLDLSKVKFGSTLLTEYFSFKKPDMAEMKEEKDKIIADSSFFPINSQAALQFYQSDPTVQSVYKRMYHVGWPLESKTLGNTSNPSTITGGQNQKNGCHIAELTCACAAYDFFTLKEISNDKVAYFFKSIDYNQNTFNFSGSDLVGTSGNIFMNKLGSFLSFAHIALSYKEASSGNLGVKAFLTQLGDNKIPDYNSITDDETKNIDEFLRFFGYKFDSNNFVPGWIYQIYNTVKPGNFIFHSKAFTENQKELNNIEVGEFFIDSKHHWDGRNKYDTFIKNLTNENAKPKDTQKVSSTKEKFLAHIYNGITISQKFNLNQ